MSNHNHTHSCSCEHTEVKYCKHCRTVYCTGCNQEWNTKFNWNSYYTNYNTNPNSWTYPTGTLTRTSGYVQTLDQNTASAPAQVDTVTISTCSHSD